MDFDLLKTYIQPEVLVLIPVLYLIGLFLRQTPKIPSWLDVWVQLVAAIGACIFLIGFSVDAFIQGVLVAGAAVLVKDLINRTSEGVVEIQNNKGLPDGVARDPETGQFVSKEEVEKDRREE